MGVAANLFVHRLCIPEIIPVLGKQKKILVGDRGPPRALAKNQSIIGGAFWAARAISPFGADSRFGVRIFIPAGHVADTIGRGARGSPYFHAMLLPSPAIDWLGHRIGLGPHDLR